MRKILAIGVLLFGTVFAFGANECQNATMPGNPGAWVAIQTYRDAAGVQHDLFCVDTISDRFAIASTSIPWIFPLSGGVTASFFAGGPNVNSQPFSNMGHIGATSGGAGLDFAGRCTMSAGACPAITFNVTWAANPGCVATWNGTGTLTGVVKAISTTTTLNISSSVGTDTAVMTYVCIGIGNV